MEDKGMRYFDELVSRIYGVKSNIEHYGSVVDLLGRAGNLEKALKFIEEIPLHPTASIWGSLLGACRVHSNVRIEEIVGRRLMKIKHENVENYVILSKLYASSGRWEEVGMLRDMMYEKTIRKKPVRNWIELDQTLHTFHASDRSHPKKDEIRAKMNEVVIKIKEASYEPDLSCVLHDVDTKQNEKILLGHSEKLALSFRLLSTQKGTPIVVIKNLQICVDCHNFAKFVSRIYGREVSLRDKHKNHHIVRGTCSCGDYW